MKSAIIDFKQNISLNDMRVEITIISHSFTLIPAVHNENGNNEKSEDDDITIEKEEDKISRSKVNMLNSVTAAPA